MNETPEEAAKAALAAKRAETARKQATAKDAKAYSAACAAYVKAQGEFEPLVFDKKNPHFNSAYASLQAVLKAVTPALLRNGIAMFSRPVVRGDLVLVETYLVHDGLVFMRSEWPAGKVTATPQSQGSALTYARRYSVQSLLNIAADEDDDGNTAQTATKRNAPPPPDDF